ncbi:hypothetical protein V8C34DRAFT_268400 [Trichoderma compactum]
MWLWLVPATIAKAVVFCLIGHGGAIKGLRRGIRSDEADWRGNFVLCFHRLRESKTVQATDLTMWTKEQAQLCRDLVMAG